MHTRPVLCSSAIAATVALLVTGCGSDSSGSASGSSPISAAKSQTSKPTRSTSAPTPSSAPSTPRATAPSSRAAAPASTTSRPGLPAGAYPQAGGPVPKGAKQLSVDPETGSALVRSPSGNNGCELGGPYWSVCTTTAKTFPPPDPSVDGGFLTVDLSKPTASLEGMGTDMPEWSRSGQVLEYGETGYWKTYVCHSAESGLTCWNTGTGHGALVNSSGIKTF